MPNWAVVIGIDQYKSPNLCLRGAVRDALKMREWLTSVDGGAVPTRNMELLLAPGDSSPRIPAGVKYNAPGYEEIVEAIDYLINRSGGQGERFFFYYSGHGLMSRLNHQNESAITAANFSPLLTTMSIKLGSIYEKFQATEFQEQFFFIDACRNIPWEGEFLLGAMPRPGGLPKPPVPPQFIMYATSPGLTAAEIQLAGDERGAFTDALLDGLQGKGVAKLKDDSAQEYVVSWERLFKHVEAAVRARQLGVDMRRVPPLFQEPRQFGERGSQNPCLGRFSFDAFPEEPLDVVLDPTAAAPESEVVIGDLGGTVSSLSGISQLPARFPLKPGTYSVRASAPHYLPERRYYQVDLYEPATVSIKFKAATPAPDAAAGAPPPPPPWQIPKGLEGDRTLIGFTKGERFRDLGEVGEEAPKISLIRPRPTSLQVESSDPLARLQLLDSTANIIATGEGSIWRQGLPPGFYRARLVTPSGRYLEELIELEQGETETVAMSAPPPPDTPLFREIVAASGMNIREDNTIEPSEAVGPISSAKLSTLLALAGGAANEETSFGARLRRMGVRSFRQSIGEEAANGVQVLFGVERPDPEDAAAYLDGVKLRCWGREEAISAQFATPLMARGASIPGIADYAWKREPGPCWLSLETPDQPPLAMAVVVLPGRLTLVVVHLDAARQLNIYQYLPSLEQRDPPDPRRSMARFPVLQRSELIQRAYMSGRLEEPGENAMELLYAKWVEPIAGCLGGYILLKVNPKHDLLSIASDNMARYFGELPDSHVLQGAHLAATGHDDLAANSFRQALDRGLPIMSDGLVHLSAAIERYGLAHPEATQVQQALQSRAYGSPWTIIAFAAGRWESMTSGGASSLSDAESREPVIEGPLGGVLAES